MGYEYKGTCYGSEAQASDAYYSTYAPSSLLVSNDLIQFQFVPVNGIWKLQKLTTDSTGNQSTNFLTDITNPPTFRTCDYVNDPSQQFKDGMDLGWYTVGVMVAVWCIRRIYR